MCVKRVMTVRTHLKGEKGAFCLKRQVADPRNQLAISSVLVTSPYAGTHWGNTWQRGWIFHVFPLPCPHHWRERLPRASHTQYKEAGTLLCRNEQNGVLRLPQCCCVGATAHIWDETHHSPGQSMRLRVQSCLVSGPHLSTASPVSLEAPDHKSHRPQPGAPMGLQEWLHQEHGLRISFILKKLQDSEPLTIPLWASVSL